MSDFLNSVQSLDAYAKTLDDFSIKTFSGGLVTVISTTLIGILIFSKFHEFLTPTFKPQLVVDSSRKQLLPIHANITFPHLPCFLLAIDVMDASGEQQNQVDHDIFKIRLDKYGKVIDKSKTDRLGTKTTNYTNTEVADPNYCGDCYGSAVQDASGKKMCCNTCKDVVKAYELRGWSMNDLTHITQCVNEGWADKLKNERGEGCRVEGYLSLKKVAGNFHFAPGLSFEHHHMHFHDLEPFKALEFDFTHVIHRLSFGELKENMINPLDNHRKETSSRTHVYNYYVKVVSTQFTYLDGSEVYTNQYAATEYEKKDNVNGPVGLFFFYDISPITIIYQQHKILLSAFLIDVCAIVGGIFTVAGLIDSFIYRTEKKMKFKLDLGKAN